MSPLLTYIHPNISFQDHLTGSVTETFKTPYDIKRQHSIGGRIPVITFFLVSFIYQCVSLVFMTLDVDHWCLILYPKKI